MVPAVVVRVIHYVRHVVISGTGCTGIAHFPLAVDFHLVVPTRLCPRCFLGGGVEDVVADAADTPGVEGVVQA